MLQRRFLSSSSCVRNRSVSLSTTASSSVPIFHGSTAVAIRPTIIRETTTSATIPTHKKISSCYNCCFLSTTTIVPTDAAVSEVASSSWQAIFDESLEKGFLGKAQSIFDSSNDTVWKNKHRWQLFDAWIRANDDDSFGALSIATQLVITDNYTIGDADDEEEEEEDKNNLTNRRIQLLDVWIDYQKRLIRRQLDLTTTTTTAKTTIGTQENNAEFITRAAEQAHNLLETIEPFLGARSVWLHPSLHHHRHPDKLNDDDRSLSATTALLEDAVTTSRTSWTTMNATARMASSASADAAATVLKNKCEEVLTAWARAMRVAHAHRFIRGIPQRAQFLLERMEASCEHANNINKAEDRHRKQQQQQQQEQQPLDHVSVSFMVPPTIYSYNRVLETWAFSREHLRGMAAERVFQKLVATNQSLPAESYQLVMTAWALSNDARFAYRSSGFLMKMMRIREAQLRRNDSSPIIIGGKDIANVDIHGDELDWEPTLDHYRMVFKAWSHSEEKNAPLRAHALLLYLEEKFRKGTTMIRPDEVCYRYVLQAAARRPQMEHLGTIVDDCFVRMREDIMVIDAHCYSAAIKTWKNAAVHVKNASSSARESSVIRAVDLLKEMELANYRSTRSDVQVSTKNVNDVLEALTSSNSHMRIEEADNLLRKMENAMQDGNTNLMPNMASYVHTLQVLKSIHSAEKVARAKVILWRFVDNFDAIASQYKKRGVLVEVFNEFIRVCGSRRTRSVEEGLQTMNEALSSIQTMRGLEGIAPNSSMYATLLEACASLLPVGKDRQLFAEKVFRLCCEDGMVDENVLRQMRAVASLQLFSSLIVSASVLVEGTKVVPESWTSNTMGGKVISVDGRKTKPLSIDGRVKITAAMYEFRMRRLRDKRNRNLLRGGRWRPPKYANRREPFQLYDGNVDVA